MDREVFPVQGAFPPTAGSRLVMIGKRRAFSRLSALLSAGVAGVLLRPGEAVERS